MPRPGFEKSPQRLVDTFNAVKPGPPAEARQMFGYPACFANGNMFMGLFQEDMILRLSEESREELAKLGGKPFEPMRGRVMREYVTVPASLIANRARLSSWVARALEYGLNLPPKKAAKRKPVRKKNR